MKARRARAAWLPAALAACLSGNLTAQTPWTELRGNHFILQGATDARRLQPVACEIEEALSALALRPDTASIPSVIAAANERAMREVLPQYWARRGPRPLGGYWSGPYGHHIAVRIDVRREERVRRLLHEFTHFATHLSQSNPPRWVDEGLSELWEHAAIEADRVEIGRPVPRHLKLLQSDRSWIPLADLLSATALPDRGTGSKVSMFYAQSWALVHYLLFEKGTGKVDVQHLLALDTFPTDQELRRYVRAALPGPAKIPLAPSGVSCTGPMTIRNVPLVESLIVRARALADGERPDDALPLLGEALRRQPANRDARETIGVVHFAGNRFQKSADVFDRLIAENEGTHRAYYYRALLAGPVPEKTDGSGPVSAPDYLREAIRLNPGFLPARQRLQELVGKEAVAPCPLLCQSKLD